MARNPQGSRDQTLRHIMSMIDQQRQQNRVSYAPEAISPQFAYPGNPYRNPFEAPLGALQSAAQAVARPVDAGGRPISPQILAAMDRMRQRRAQGFMTAGQLLDQQARQQGLYNPSPLWA